MRMCLVRLCVWNLVFWSNLSWNTVALLWRNILCVWLYCNLLHFLYIESVLSCNPGKISPFTLRKFKLIHTRNYCMQQVHASKKCRATFVSHNMRLEGKMSDVCVSVCCCACVSYPGLRTRAPHGSAIGRPSTRDLRHAISLHTFTFP